MNVSVKASEGIGGFIGIGILVWLFASWLTHIITCLSEEAWGFLIAGAIFAPIGVIHGTGVWFGAW